MHKIRPFFLLAIIFLSFQAVPVAAIKTDSDVLRDLNLDSKSIILIDTDRQKTILAKNSDQQMPVASLTKIMTALVALEKRKLDETVSISRDMISDLRDYVTIGLQTGQQVTVEDLLYATMLPSAAAAVNALALSINGSYENHLMIMNAKAKELELNNTHYSNVIGLYDKDNYSSAYDTAEKTFSKRDLIIGGKTGYTELAGRCLASNTKLNGVNYILITLGANPESLNHIKDTEKIYQYVKDTYIEQEILQKDEIVKTVAVTDSKRKSLGLKAEEGAKAVLHKELNRDSLTYKYEGVETITQDIKLGAKLGTYSIFNGDEKLYETDVYLRDEIEYYNYPLIIATFVGGGILGVGLIIAVFKIARSSAKRR